MKRRLLITASFACSARRLAKLHPGIRDAIDRTTHLLELDAFAPQLKSHKLSGKHQGRWACSAGYDLRIVFELVQEQGESVVMLHAIGSHDEVY